MTIQKSQRATPLPLNWLKTIIRKATFVFQKGMLPCRLPTWRRRMSPDFLIVGTMKSGTTSLYRYLSQHPQLVPSYVKEVGFFDSDGNFEKGEAWYRAHFPLQTNKDYRAFEATPGYTFYSPATQRIFAFNPKIKLIMLLRNPTERAISNYFHVARMYGMEPLPTVKDFPTKDDSQGNTQVRSQQPLCKFSYKRRGLYAQQIKRLLDYFPEEQILILSSELFSKHPERSLKQVFEFVGVDAGFKIKDLSTHNIGRNKTGVDPAVRQYLNDYFLPYNKQLYELVGKDFGWEEEPN